MTALLVYGANGYSGRLIVQTLCERGARPNVAGRNAQQVSSMGRELGCEHRSFGIDDADALAQGLAGVSVVLHCAGPFSGTARPMLEACM